MDQGRDLPLNSLSTSSGNGARPENPSFFGGGSAGACQLNPVPTAGWIHQLSVRTVVVAFGRCSCLARLHCDYCLTKVAGLHVGQMAARRPIENRLCGGSGPQGGQAKKQGLWSSKAIGPGTIPYFSNFFAALEG